MLPNFLILGAARSGTTSLYNYAGQHPDVFLSPVKETNFFAYDGERFELHSPRARGQARLSVSSLAEYRALFRGVRGEKAIGEASPSYLASSGAPTRIHRTIPGARLVAILRDPAERAYACYMGFLRDGAERNLDPLDAIGAALAGRDLGWRSHAYIREGLYYEHLLRYFELFDRERIRIYLFEEFIGDPICVMRDLFSFLGVEESFVPDTSRVYNFSGRVRNPLLRAAWVRWVSLRRRLGAHLPRTIRNAGFGLIRRSLVRPPLPPELRSELLQHYRADILKLEDLLGRDLSHWLT